MLLKQFSVFHTLENVGKGQNVGNQHFLPFSAMFNPFPNNSWFLCVCSISLLKTLWEKGEIASNEQFFLFPQCFLPILKNFLPLSSHLKLSSANSLNLEESKICRLGKG